MVLMMSSDLYKDIRSMYYDTENFDKEAAKNLLAQNSTDGFVDITAFTVRNDGAKPYKVLIDVNLASQLIDAMQPENIDPDALFAGAITKAFISHHNNRSQFSVGHSNTVDYKFDDVNREIRLYPSLRTQKIHR